MAASLPTQLGQRSVQLRRRLPSHDVLAGASVARQDVKRNEELAACGVDRKCREQPGNGVREAGMAAWSGDISGAGQNAGRGRAKTRRGALSTSLLSRQTSGSGRAE